jgi:dienelactone hydrolase
LSRSRQLALPALVVALLAVLAPAAHAAFDASYEAKNYSKVLERQAIYSTPEYQAQLRRISLINSGVAQAAQIADPEREFVTDLCWNGFDGCAGDTRLYDWQENGYGIVEPVLFTARSGATLSGHVWATKAGPAKRPGIVITNGSVQADEQLYWFVAQVLAKSGYVVLTWDPQGQGQSDTRGEAPDENEGFPAQSDGRPFFDGTQDALNFFFSTADRPYHPVKSCASGTSHAAKQKGRAKAGLNAAYNPFYRLLDHSRVGIAGHSYGAGGVSYIGQADPRVKAIVAWDNLATADDPGSREETCVDASARKPHALRKPALGMSADYFLPPTPNTSKPDPRAKSQASFAYSKAGTDTGELIIRGGSHLDFDWIPNPGFGATLRGADFIDWYTTAWFDKYVKGDPGADARLLTNRWRHDAPEAAVDPDGDGNMFSRLYRSRFDITLSDGARFSCESLRSTTKCPRPIHPDSRGPGYDFVKIATRKDGPATTGNVPGHTRGIWAYDPLVPVP